jgi:hypothetical protein
MTRLLTRFLMPALMLAAVAIFAVPLVDLALIAPAITPEYVLPVIASAVVLASAFWLLATLSFAKVNDLLTALIKARFDAYEQRLLARAIS